MTGLSHIFEDKKLLVEFYEALQTELENYSDSDIAHYRRMLNKYADESDMPDYSKMDKLEVICRYSKLP